MTWIAFLRGINVSGQKPVRMEALRGLFEELGFSGVRSYLQSGNVLFERPSGDPEREAGFDPAGELSAAIEAKIFETFGFEVPVLVLDAGGLKRLLEDNPLRGKAVEFLHLTLLKEPPKALPLADLQKAKAGEEDFAVSDKAVYLYCPHGYGTTKLSNGFFEKKLGVRATTRNLKTLGALIEMAFPGKEDAPASRES